MERNTRQRETIRTVLTEADRPLSPREILARGRRDVGGMSLATVYRTVRALLEEGYIVTVDLPGEPARYERAGKAHHHHFHCRDCGRAFEVHGCPGQLNELAPAGFVVEGHELTLYGRCERCARDD